MLNLERNERMARAGSPAYDFEGASIRTSSARVGFFVGRV